MDRSFFDPMNPSPGSSSERSRPESGHRRARLVLFLRERLKPGSHLGRHLTVGAIVVLLAGYWFGSIVEDLEANDPMVAVDHQVSAWFNRHASDSMTRCARLVTFLGSGLFLAVASLATAAVLYRHRAWHRLVLLVAAVGGGSLLNVVLKHHFQRARPVFDPPLVELSTYSFPSGHTIGATLFYGLLAIFILQTPRYGRWRALAPLLALLLTLVVALSRIYLGAHFLSDVMAAMAVGIAWLAASVTAVGINWRRRQPQRPATRPDSR